MAQHYSVMSVLVSDWFKLFCAILHTEKCGLVQGSISWLFHSVLPSGHLACKSGCPNHNANREFPLGIAVWRCLYHSYFWVSNVYESSSVVTGRWLHCICHLYQNNTSIYSWLSLKVICAVEKLIIIKLHLKAVWINLDKYLLYKKPFWFCNIGKVKWHVKIQSQKLCKILWNLKITKLKGHQYTYTLNSPNIRDANIKGVTVLHLTQTCTDVRGKIQYHFICFTCRKTLQ